MIFVKAFGGFEVRDEAHGPVAALLAQPKRSALLAYLVIAHAGGFCRRDTLLALFWPDQDEEGARRALSQALTFLRRHLNNVLVTRGPDELGVDPARVRSDVHDFEQALAQRDWEGALARYGGPFLEGLHVAGAAPFVDWVDRERERLREAASAAAWKHADSLIAAGRLVDAERTAQRALTLVPTDESPVRAFIEALAAAGERAAALRFYEKFKGLLARELDVEPARETRAVAETVRDARFAPLLAAGSPREGGASVEGPPPRAASSPGGRVHTYELYNQGLFKLNEYNERDVDGAIEALEAAVAEEPSFAAARCALANAYNEKADLSGPRRDLREKAHVQAEAALLLDPELAEAHVARGNVIWNQETRFPHQAALREFRRAVELKPELGLAHERLATVYSHIGLLDLALAEASLALELNPLDYWARFKFALALWAQQRYAEAAEELTDLPRQVAPIFRGAMLAEATLYLGRPLEALSSLNKLIESFPTDPWIKATRALVYASLGDSMHAEADIAGAREHLYLPTHAHHAEFTMGCAYAVLGHAEEAVHWLRHAAYNGWPCYPRYAGDPLLAGLRDDPRFAGLLHELKGMWQEFRSEFDRPAVISEFV